MIALKKNGEYVYEYTPSYQNQSIVIAIDSSKSNSALIVGTPRGRVLDDYEISGSGSDVDVYDLCKFTRAQLKNLFDGAQILFVGIEDIITKKSDGKSGGLEIHQSRAKITAIFNNYIFLFQEYFDITPKFISNWSWKSGILPEAFRTKNHKKGSKDWLKSLGSEYGGRKDDVTDALCIFMYIIKTFKFKIIDNIDATCPTNKDYMYTILPESFDKVGVRWFNICNNDSLEHNITTVAERCSSNEVALFKFPINKLSIDIIYSDKLQKVGNYTFTRKDKEVVVFVGVK